MKMVSRNAPQGDVWFIRVDKLPDDVKLLEEGKKVIVAHSESGHHHIATAEKVRLYGTSDPLVCYLVNETGAHMDIIHERPFDTHETMRLLDGPWKIVRQREMTLEGWRPVED